jgi:hypothetical protein
MFETFKVALVRNIRKSYRRNLLKKLNAAEGTKLADLERLVDLGKSVAGYIPFIRGQTDIIIYNFFGVNYGFRTEANCVIVYTDENFQPLEVAINRLRSRHILYLPGLPSNSIAPTFCVCLVLHERLQKNHGLHDGHLRFWGVWDGFSALTHSMPLPISTRHEIERRLNFSRHFPIPKEERKFDRRMYPHEADVVTHFSHEDGTVEIDNRGDLSESLRLTYGFSVIQSADLKVKGCFHETPLNRNFSDDESYVEHVVAVPATPDIDVLFFFGECCELGSAFRVRFFRQQHGLDPHVTMVHKVDLYISDHDPVRLSELLPNFATISKDDFWVSFEQVLGKRKPHYINVFYSSISTDRIFDCVHSHSFTKTKSQVEQRPRALKFAPFKIGKHDYLPPSRGVTYDARLAVWGDLDYPIDIRLRIFSGSCGNFEVVIPKTVPSRTVSFFRLQDFVSYEPNVPHAEVYIVQLESEKQNLQGTLLCSSSLPNSTIFRYS